VESKKAPRVESAHRALVLVKLINENGSISVTEAAAALGVNASTAHRLLMTLAYDGFSTQRSDRRYGIGPALGQAGTGVTTVSARLRPALERLFERTGETVHCSILVGTRVQLIDGIEASAHALRFSLRVGVWIPAHLASGGKALLADLADDEVDARYGMALAGPPSHRPDVDLESLHEQLDDIRESRIAWNFGESEPGLAAMSISVALPGGPRAALTVALPISRYTKESGERWAADLIEIADEIESGGLRTDALA